MNLEDIKTLITQQFPDVVTDVTIKSSPQALEIKPEAVFGVCKFLHENEQLYFDMLSCITGIDNGVEANAMEVIYNLYSIPFDLHLMLKVTIDRENPSVDSVQEIWKTALWHERETFDLFGIAFNNHPDLRRILLPADWEGFPLRKDYEHQEKYHGIKVKY